MKNKIKAQLQLMLKRKSFILIMTIAILGCVVYNLYNNATYYGASIMDVRAAKYLYIGADMGSYGNIFYRMIFPLLVVIPFSDSFYEERKRKTTVYCLSRQSNNDYYYSKLVAVFISGFLVAAVPLLINFILNLVAFPLDSSVTWANTHCTNGPIFISVIERDLFTWLLAENMYLYHLVFMLITSLVGGFACLVVYQLSFFWKSSRIFLLCSFFMAYFLLTAVLDSFGYNTFVIEKYMYAGVFSRSITVYGCLVTFGLLVLAALLPIPFAKKRINNCYD